MNNSSVEKFLSIKDSISKKQISDDEIIILLKEINFYDFSLEDIQLVEDSDWIPIDFQVEILRNWINNQDNIIDSIKTYLFFKNTISNDLFKEFLDLCLNPNKNKRFEVKNILKSILTANETRPIVDITSLDLFNFKSEIHDQNHLPQHGFSQKNNEYFQSYPKNNSFLEIILPNFMTVSLTNYKFSNPTQYGLKSWIIQGSNDGINYIDIDVQINNSSLLLTNSTINININENNNYYNRIKITQIDFNHSQTLYLVISQFDFSGFVKFSNVK